MMHAGRHSYASVQLEAGTSIRRSLNTWVIQTRGLHFASTHLTPQAEDKAKRAVDDVFNRLESVANDPLRGPAVAPRAV